MAHNALVLHSAASSRTLIFESQTGSPIAKLYLDSYLQDSLFLRQVTVSKFSRLFDLEQTAGVVVCTFGQQIILLKTKDFRLKLLKIAKVGSKYDTTPVQHVEAMGKLYLLVMTQRALYRVTIDAN